MAPTSTAVDPRHSFIISRNLQKMRNKYNLILQKKKYLDQKGEFVGSERQKLIRSKHSVAGKIAVLERLLKEFSSVELSLSPQVDTANEADPATSGAKRGRGGPLHTPKSRSLALSPHMPAQQNQSASLSKEELSSSMNIENETKGSRFLLLSNGYAICCLDLKNSTSTESVSNFGDVPPLPEIATLKLMEEGLPVSVGLFKLGSDAYMIGGQKHPPLSEAPSDTCCLLISDDWGYGWRKNPSGYNLYSTLCLSFNLKGTSRVTHRLSLDNDGTLSHSKGGGIGKLKKPKFWPIVEKIQGQIHVIDSAPEQFHACSYRDWIFSHERLNHHSWEEIPTLDKPVLIRSHLVVGNRMYAVGDPHRFVVFDSNTNEWEEVPGRDWSNHLSPQNVWHCLSADTIARCAGEFPLGGGGEASNPLYVVVAILRDFPKNKKRTLAMAYLVTSKGEVVCVQRLRRFFNKPIKPWVMSNGAMIDADEEGKTMCSIVNGSALLKREDDVADKNHVFINTFSVEMLSEAASKVQEIYAGGRKATGWPVVVEFVRIHMKQSHIFETDDVDGDLPEFLGVQACFI